MPLVGILVAVMCLELVVGNLLVLDGARVGVSTTTPQVPKGLVTNLYGQGLARDADSKVVDYWRDLDGQIVRIKPLVIKRPEGDLEFDVVTIGQREGNLRPMGDLINNASSSYVGFVPSVMSHVRKFAMGIYEAEGGPNAIAAVKKERDFYNGVSTMVVICEKNDLSRIRAVFRIVRRGEKLENQLLDAEVHNKVRLPELKSEIQVINGKRVAVGDWAELKTLAQDKELGISLVPYLVFALDENDYLAFTNRKVKINGETLPLGASHLVLETDEPRRNYYERSFGFKVDEERSRMPIYVMTQSIEDFRKSFRLLTRRAGESLKPYLESTPRVAWNYLPVPNANIAEGKTPFYLQRPPAEPPQKIGPRSYQVPYTVTYKIGAFVTTRERGFKKVTEERAFSPTPLDQRVPLRAEPYHPFDFFQRLGLPLTATREQIYRAYYDVHTAHSLGNTLGWDPFASRKIEEAADELGLHRHGQDFAFEAAQRIREIYHRFGQEGFADPRFDPDPPLSSRTDHITRLLLNPERFFNEIQAAVDEALEHRHEDPRLDAALASIAKLPDEVWRRWIDQAIYNLSQNYADRQIFEQRIYDLVNELIAKIELSFEENPPTHPRAIERLIDHGRPSRAGFRAFMAAADVSKVGELVYQSVYMGGYRSQDLFEQGLQQAKDILFRHRLKTGQSEEDAINEFVLRREARMEYSFNSIASYFRLSNAIHMSWPALSKAFHLEPKDCKSGMKAIVRYVKPKTDIVLYRP